MEDRLVRLERAIGGQAEPLERRSCKLHRRLRAGRNQVTVCDRALVDEVLAARIAGGEQVPSCRAGVTALVQQTSSGETGCGTADGRDGNTGVEEACVFFA